MVVPGAREMKAGPGAKWWTGFEMERRESKASFFRMRLAGVSMLFVMLFL